MNSSRYQAYIAITIALVSSVLASVAFFKKEKIAYVNSVKLFRGYYGSIKAKEEYDKKLSNWKANVDTLTKEFNLSVSKFEKEKGRMTENERKLSQELLAAKHQQVESYRSAVSENAAKEDQVITIKINGEISRFLEEYGRSHGYDFILGATSAGNILFAEKKKDITDEVLQELNKGRAIKR